MQWAKLTGRVKSTLTTEDVKVCGFCDALNHRENGECFLCGWHGAFTMDEAQISFAWRRLEDEYEEVRLAHITKSRRGTVEELGAVADRNVFQEARHRTRTWWHGFLDARDRRAALREAHLRSHQIKHSAQ